MRILNLLICFLFLIVIQLAAQPGALIPGFGQSGVVVTTNQGEFNSIGIQSDGKIIVSNGHVLYRYNSDGTKDLGFGTNGSSNIGFFAFDMIVQPADNKIVVLGSTIIRRFTADGSLDASFNGDGSVTVELLAITIALKDLAIDHNNKIVACGQASWINGSDEIKTTTVVRLNPDGTLDATFNNVGIRNYIYGDGIDRSAEQCAIGLDNKIILKVDVNDASNPFAIFRYNSDGTTDTQFGNSGSLNVQRLEAIQIDNAGRTLYVQYGILPSQNNLNQTTYSELVRLNMNGTQDFSFSVTGMSSSDFLLITFKCIILQANGKILVAGIENVSIVKDNVWMARFNPDGSLDQTFGSSGIVKLDLNYSSGISDIIVNNRRIYGAGFVHIDEGPSSGYYGLLVAYDGTDVLLQCPGNTSVSTNAGQCYATPGTISPILIPPPVRPDREGIPFEPYASIHYTKEYNGTIEEGTGSLSGSIFNLGTTHVTYSLTDVTTQTCSFDVTVYDGDPPVARCKNVTVQLDATGNGTLTAAQVDNGSTDGCGIQSRSLSKTSFSCSDPSSNTVTLTVTDVHGNSSSCTATITVEDNVPPVAKCKNVTVYLDASGNGSITPAQIDDGSTDACGIKNLSLDKTTFNCSNKGSNTVTLTVTDNHDNTATCTATVTVLDIIPPIISSVVPTPIAIWPSDRKMKNVTIATTSTDNCIVNSCRITGVAIKAGEFANDNIGPDWEITGTNTVNLRAELPKKGVKRIYTVTVTCTDASNNSSTSTTDVIVAHNITTPASGATVKIGSTINLAGEFWDVPGKKHTAKWLIDDKTINGTVTEPSGMNSGTVTGSYKFTTAGVYKIQMNVTDQNGITSYSNTSENLEAIVVVYDPSGGYTYGGGYFNSPKGALKNNPNASGDASYGFTVNYYKNATLPKGETQFEFKIGDFEFNALNFEYLVISNSMSQFKGTGKIIGGQSGVGFIMTVTDGQLDGTGIDKVRMKIYNKNNGQVYYDNQPGASDAANPITVVGNNSSVVIQTTVGHIAQKSQSNEEVIEAVKELEVRATPNPANNNFNVYVRSNNLKDRIIMQVMDMYGRLIETRNVNTHSTIRFGDLYRSGIYFIRIIQGKEHREIKLIKQPD
ncbi:MAG: T9SS type A sorting domain-containing protein [Bacteroidota bacterium]